MNKSREEREAAARAAFFFKNLKHTKGKWYGQDFNILDWQNDVINDVFGTLGPDGYRQYREAYIEIPKKNGKSEIAGGVGLFLVCADGEPAAEVYSAAGDRGQAKIIYRIAKSMVNQSPELTKRSQVLKGSHSIYFPTSDSIYQAISSETYTKHGPSTSGLIFDEFHTQPNRELYDVLTKGSGAARNQPLFLYITTAGNNINSICYELHQYAKAVISGDIEDPTFYARIYGLEPEDDWEDEANWYKANPSLGQILNIEEFRKAYQDARRNLAEENIFKQLRLNIWVKQSTRWMRMSDWDGCGDAVDLETLKGRPCYGGLDLSTNIDLTALSLVFIVNGRYVVLMRFWMPEATAEERERQDHNLRYRQWSRDGYIKLTPGNRIDYKYIREELKKLREIYDIKELAYDRWGAAKLAAELEEDGFTIDPKEKDKPIIFEFGQGYKSMSPPTKDLMYLVLGKEIAHGGNPVLRWNVDNLVIEQDAAGNIKPNKAKSTQRIDGAVAMIMAIDRAIKHRDDDKPSVYEDRGVLVL